MTQEDKELLLTDLCARLPYGVILQYTDKTFFPQGEIKVNRKLAIDDALQHRLKLLDFKPYLRPMSSMTAEEMGDLEKYLGKKYDFRFTETESFIYIDWLNAHHFDYRGLIERGLALEAPEGMYNTK